MALYFTCSNCQTNRAIRHRFHAYSVICKYCDDPNLGFVRSYETRWKLDMKWCIMCKAERVRYNFYPNPVWENFTEESDYLDQESVHCFRHRRSATPEVGSQPVPSESIEDALDEEALPCLSPQSPTQDSTISPLGSPVLGAESDSTMIPQAESTTIEPPIPSSPPPLLGAESDSTMIPQAESTTVEPPLPSSPAPLLGSKSDSASISQAESTAVEPPLHSSPGPLLGAESDTTMISQARSTTTQPPLQSAPLTSNGTNNQREGKREVRRAAKYLTEAFLEALEFIKEEDVRKAANVTSAREGDGISRIDDSHNTPGDSGGNKDHAVLGSDMATSLVVPEPTVPTSQSPEQLGLTPEIDRESQWKESLDRIRQNREVLMKTIFLDGSLTIQRKAQAIQEANNETLALFKRLLDSWRIEESHTKDSISSLSTLLTAEVAGMGPKQLSEIQDSVNTSLRKLDLGLNLQDPIGPLVRKEKVSYRWQALLESTAEELDAPIWMKELVKALYHIEGGFVLAALMLELQQVKDLFNNTSFTSFIYSVWLKNTIMDTEVSLTRFLRLPDDRRKPITDLTNRLFAAWFPTKKCEGTEWRRCTSDRDLLASWPFWEMMILFPHDAHYSELLWATLVPNMRHQATQAAKVYACVFGGDSYSINRDAVLATHLGTVKYFGVAVAQTLTMVENEMSDNSELQRELHLLVDYSRTALEQLEIYYREKAPRMHDAASAV